MTTVQWGGTLGEAVPKVYGITHPAVIVPGGGPILEQVFSHYIRRGYGTVTGKAAFEVHHVQYAVLKDLEKELTDLTHLVGVHCLTFPLWEPTKWLLTEVFYENIVMGPMIYSFHLSSS